MHGYHIIVLIQGRGNYFKRHLEILFFIVRHFECKRKIIALLVAQTYIEKGVDFNWIRCNIRTLVSRGQTLFRTGRYRLEMISARALRER